MANHENINQIERDLWQQILRDRKAEAEIAVLTQRAASVEKDLEAIFNAIRAGKRITLRYRNGDSIDIQAVEEDAHG